ncbi:phosphatidate cytidylyltransferase [Mariniblastus fucicola]|uniref:Phosphatidate cytidylyltransferase n=1 Tax=Mariniblastus fucicola TaxID=980251 RepID=A0A5B9PFN9_9BACT|nr:phosphatidate cytidylyltransferase [Mariniblastus fucicola]QEG24010.1 Phosphatidate cytidylyltransferase [Mariniblastus fucicola]
MLLALELLPHLSVEVLQTFGGLFVLLAISSVIVWLKNQRRFDFSDELTARTVTWWGIVLCLFVAIVASKLTAIILLGVISFFAMREYFHLVSVRESDKPVLIWALLSVPVQFYWVSIGWIGMFLVFIPVYMFILLPTRIVLGGNTDGFVKAVGAIQWGLMTTVFSLSHAAMLVTMPLSETPHVDPVWFSESARLGYGPALLVLLLVLTQLNDIAQFCWGKALGRRKILPSVSPGKTVVGMVGGVCTTVVIAGIVGPWLTVFDLPRALMAGLIVGLAGFGGDVCISAIKRDLGVKDSGSFLPGHGGLLDRLDSLTFAAPLFFHFTYYFYG